MALFYLESPSTSPSFNLALEQYLFDALPRAHEYLMLWQNDNAIIVGKYQNTAAEINAAFVEQRGIRVVRRLSGGGAVYHDLGNLNFTFVAAAKHMAQLSFAAFCQPVVRALARMGVQAELSGRNDMTIDGKKFSGNAQYMRDGRVMHHGTILYDCDLTVLERALRPPQDKLASKGVASVRSRVTNVKEYLPRPVALREFWQTLKDNLTGQAGCRQWELSDSDLAAVRAIEAARYATWEWNYGASPRYAMEKRRRVEGCGSLAVHMEVTGGAITALALYGDFFGAGDLSPLTGTLLGCKAERGALLAALAPLEVGQFIHGLSAAQLAEVILS